MNALKMLDLSSNKIRRVLPTNCDRQYVQSLKSVVSLNLSDNPLKSLRETTDQLQTLMPNLTDLQISLFDELDVDYIITHMPQLAYLNNFPVEREELLAEQIMMNASSLEGLL